MLSSVDSTCKSTLLLALTDKSASAEDPYSNNMIATNSSPLPPCRRRGSLSLSPSLPSPPTLSCSRAPAFLQLVVSLLSLPPQPRAIRGSGLSGWPTVPQPLHPTRARSLPTSLPSSNEGGLRCVGRCRCYRCGGRDGARAMTRAASPSSKPNLSYMPCHLPALPLSLPLLLALSLSLSLQHILLGKWPQSPFPFSPRSIFAEGGGGGGDGCLPLGFSSPFALPLPALVVVRCCSKGRSLHLGEVR